MEPWVAALIAAGATILGSGGFWAWLSAKNMKQSSVNKLILGLAYDKLIERGTLYIEKGWISKDELEDFIKLFYQPYIDLGGNGVAKTIADRVQQLEIRGPARFVAIDNTNTVRAEVINELR